MKHFIALAELLRSMRPVDHGNYGAYNEGFQAGRQAHHAHMIEQLANFCQSQNPNFKRDIWIGYIEGKNGPNGGKI